MKGQKLRSQTIIIVGAGMVGLMAAALLLKKGFYVRLVERNPLSLTLSDKVSVRVSAINRGSWQLFNLLGLWESISARACAYQHMRVWDKNVCHQMHFNASKLAEPWLGHIVENEVMSYTLWQYCQPFLQTGQLTLANPFVINEMKFEHKSWHLQSETGQKLTGDFLIAADGAQSWVREKMGIDIKQKPYDQKALVATVQLESTHQLTAWQRFLPEGPVALLPLFKENMGSFVWSTQTETADKLLALSEDAFIEAFNSVFVDSDLVPVKCLLSERVGFPLGWQHANTYQFEGGVLVGDAAHRIHPLAGQGVNLGFADVAALVDILIKVSDAGRSIASKLVGQKYESTRRLSNGNVLHAMTALNKIYRSQSGWLSDLRNKAVSFLDRSTFIKAILLEGALNVLPSSVLENLS